MQRRVISNRKIHPEAVGALECYKSVQQERELHDQIVSYCNNQWPKWKFIHARMDKPSGIEEGAQDFTIFMPNKQVLCIECKSKGKKPDEKQRDWAFEMHRLGHTVHCVRSFEEFLATIPTQNHHDNARSEDDHHVRD